MVRNVAAIRDALPPAGARELGILVGNYGEAGSLELLGPAYHLPPPISRTNSAWLRGYPTQQPTTLIVLGFDREDVDNAFEAAAWPDTTATPGGEERGEPVAPGYLRLRPAAAGLASLLD